MIKIEQNLYDIADECENKAAELAAKYFIGIDDGMKGDSTLIDQADKILRLGRGFRELGRERYGTGNG